MLKRVAMAGLLVAALATGCAHKRTAPPPDQAPAPRVETISWGPIRLDLTFTPAAVAIDRDVLLDIKVTTPEHVSVVLPSLDDRFAGFTLTGSYEDEAATHGGQTTRSLHFRLTPQVAAEYRVAPFAVAYTDARTDPPVTGWFPTRAIVLAATPPVAGDPGPQLAGVPQPLRIRPPFRTVLGYVLLTLLGAAAIAVIWRLARRVREQVELRRLSPRERAMRELQKLLAKQLVESGRVKDFYLELTMIVRRYIERRHGIRAPEQTTEEFLAAVSRDSRFKPAVLAQLRQFLQAADMVKFAEHRPGPEAIRQATATAEGYITQDDAAATPADPAAGEGA